MATTLLFNEVQFCSDILNDLATLPIKYSYDYQFPLEKLSPLPKQSKPFTLKEYKPEIKETTDVKPTDTFTFTVKSLKGGATNSFTFAPVTTVVELKLAIAEAFTDMPAEYQRLVISGKALTNDKTLADYPIKNGSTIHLLKMAKPIPLPVQEKTTSEDKEATTSTQKEKEDVSTQFLEDLQNLVKKYYKDEATSTTIYDKLAKAYKN